MMTSLAGAGPKEHWETDGWCLLVCKTGFHGSNPATPLGTTGGALVGT